MRYNYDVETKEALNRLKENTETQIEAINEEIKKIRDEIADQLAIKELYTYRTIAKGHSGWESDIKKAVAKANDLEDRNVEKIAELERKRLKLNHDLENLNELLELDAV